MKKKILLGLGAVAIVIAGVASFSAWEAHVINVTAHIENALAVSTKALDFGTVFPQEYLEKNFTIGLSDSFKDQDDAWQVWYQIKQKPKCECDHWGTEQEELCTEGRYAAVSYTSPHVCPANYSEMKDLCRFLSKLPVDADGDDQGVPSYYYAMQPTAPDYCLDNSGFHAVGMLTIVGNLADEWIVDLKVPPVDGFIGQDWPASCADWTVEKDSQDYGCDLWIEVTNILRGERPLLCAVDGDCSSLNGWYDVDGLYKCCGDINSLCDCQKQEYREYFCNRIHCDYEVTAKRTLLMPDCISCSMGCHPGWCFDSGNTWCPLGHCIPL